MKTWTAVDYFEEESDSTSVTDLRISHSCKFCGFTFPEMQTMGNWTQGMESPMDREAKRSQELEDHLMKYHIDEIQESLKGEL